MVSEIKHVNRSMLESSNFDRFEMEAICTLRSQVESRRKPLLTIDEDDVLIDSTARYFTGLISIIKPRDAAELVSDQEMAEEEVTRRQDAGIDIIPVTKSDLFLERLMTDTRATDQCRSLYRSMKKGKLISVDDGDTEESLHGWVGLYVDDMIRAGRETRLLKGTGMSIITSRIREKFDDGNLESKLVLTALTSMNSQKKVSLWLESLKKVSKQYDGITAETKEKVMTYLQGRPAQFQHLPDLSDLIADFKHEK